MPSPYQYPWVNFFQTPTPGIDSTPLIVYGAVSTSIVDSIFVCNTTDQDIFIDISVLCEREIDSSFVVTTTYLVKKFFVAKNSSAELISLNKVNASLILEGGDIVYANSDFSGNTFDCMVSGRQLLETA